MVKKHHKSSYYGLINTVSKLNKVWGCKILHDIKNEIMFKNRAAFFSFF